MKKLINKANVDGVSVDYPYGNVRDRSAGIQGSEANTEMFGDAMQFFEKMFDESNLTASGLPDNFTNGFDLWNAFRSLTRPYKVYNALISQTGTSNPTVTVLKDEIGMPSPWSYAAVGNYRLNFSGAFPSNKTFLFINGEEDTLTTIKNISNTTIEITTKDLGTVSTDGLLDNTSVEIRIYD